MNRLRVNRGRSVTTETEFIGENPKLVSDGEVVHTPKTDRGFAYVGWDDLHKSGVLEGKDVRLGNAKVEVVD